MIQLQGVGKLKSKLERYRKETKQKLIDQIEQSATNIEIKATRNRGPKLNFIKIDKIITNGGLTAKVGVQGDDPLPVYFEFGTGLSAVSILANYPQYVKDIAQQYYINGKGNLRGQPYLFPAWFEERVRYEQGVRKILTNQANKFNN